MFDSEYPFSIWRCDIQGQSNVWNSTPRRRQPNNFSKDDTTSLMARLFRPRLDSTIFIPGRGARPLKNSAQLDEGENANGISFKTEQ